MAIYVKEKSLRSTIASATSDFVFKFRVIALTKKNPVDSERFSSTRFHTIKHEIIRFAHVTIRMASTGEASANPRNPCNLWSDVSLVFRARKQHRRRARFRIKQRPPVFILIVTDFTS